MAERLASLGYAAIKKEATKGTAVQPNVYVPYYKESINTDINLIEDMPIYGGKFKGFQQLQGQRNHKGGITVASDPNTLGYFLDMLFTKTSTTGAGPYTHVFEPSNTTDPNSYTLDISNVSQVIRYFGVQASKFTPSFDNGEMMAEFDISALGSFSGREIASVAATVVTLKTDYDPNPTNGLVATDLVRLYKASDGTFQDFTVSSLTATTVTLSGSPAAISAGDMFVLRPATPTYSLSTPFTWARTQVFFAVDAATAQTASATAANQTRLEDGLEVVVTHDFEDDGGSMRSGAFDPASLVRTLADFSFKIKQFFDQPFLLKDWNAIIKKACVIRCYTGSSTHELRITMNNIKVKDNKIDDETGNIIYQETEFASSYDQTDSKAITITIIGNVPTI